MVRTGLTIFAAVAASCCICLTASWAMQPRTGVAVVDLDEVSRRLGRLDQMQHSVQEKMAMTQQKLSFIEQDASAQLAAFRKELETAPSTEATQKFQRMQQSAVLQLNQLKQRADQELNGHRQQLVNEFRDQARPVVATVAKKHGFATVVTKNETFLFSFEKTVDITEEVAELMAALAPAAPSGPTAAKPAPAKDFAPLVKQPAEAAKPAPQAVQQVKHETP